MKDVKCLKTEKISIQPVVLALRISWKSTGAAGRKHSVGCGGQEGRVCLQKETKKPGTTAHTHDPNT